MVVRELDGLKLSTAFVDDPPVALASQAKQASKWILQMLEERPHLFRVQRKGETPGQLGHASSVSSISLREKYIQLMVNRVTI